MIDPTEILQTAVRSTLIQSPDLLKLVDSENVRSGSTIPARFPCVVMASPQTMNLGRAGGGQYCTRVFIDLHIWAEEHGANAAQQIGAVVSHLLWDTPEPNAAIIAEYTRPSFTFMRDPDPDKSYSHGVGTVEAAILWRP